MSAPSCLRRLTGAVVRQRARSTPPPRRTLSAPPRGLARLAAKQRDATSAWLAAGGDGRVTLHPSDAPLGYDVGAARTATSTALYHGVNAYGTATSPRHDVIERSSCTSSSPNESAFAAADAARLGLDLSAPPPQTASRATVSALVADNRARLMATLGLDSSVAVVMCASGT